MDALLQAITNFSDNVTTFFEELGTLFSNVLSFVVTFFKELVAFGGYLWSGLDYTFSFFGDLLPGELFAFFSIGLIIIFILRFLGRY